MISKSVCFANGQNITSARAKNVYLKKTISFSCCSLKNLMYSSVTFANLAILTTSVLTDAREKQE